jgi:hypothetical protein
MRTNSAPTSKTKVAVGRVASKAAAGSRSRVKAVSRINAENYLLS